MSVKQKVLKGIMCWAAACLMAVMCCGQALAAASAQPVFCAKKDLKNF